MGTAEAFTVCVLTRRKINLGLSPSFCGLCFAGERKTRLWFTVSIRDIGIESYFPCSKMLVFFPA